jgi:PAS domain S-box-containing protein
MRRLAATTVSPHEKPRVTRTPGGLGRATRFALLFAVLLIMAAGAAAMLQFLRTREAAELTGHTLQVLTRLDAVLQHVIEAETGQRGYLLTGDRAYLEPYEIAVKDLPAELSRLRTAIADDPEQLARLDELEPIVQARLTELESAIHLRNLSGEAAALEVVRTNYGRSAMNDLRRRINEMRDVEQSALQKNLSARDRRAGRTLALIFVGSVLAAAILTATAVALNATTRERQRADRELRESIERLRVTLRSIGDAVIATDAQGLVVFLNPVAEHLTGWSEDEARDRSLEEVFAVFDENTREAAESPVARVLRLGSVVNLADDTVLRSRHGHELPIDDSGAPIRDADGEIMGVVLVFRDITERRRALAERERTLRAEVERASTAAALRTTESERALLQTIFDTAPVGLGFFDRDLRFLRVNRALTEINGVGAEGHLGRRFPEILPGMPRDVLADLERVLRTGEPIVGSEITGETPAVPGTPRYWRASYARVCSESGEVLGLAEVVDEITDEKRAADERERLHRMTEQARAEAEDANRAKEEFLAIVSHELRSPLSAMAGWVRILAARCAGDEMVDRGLQTLERNIRVQTQIISDLLDVSRFLSGKLQLGRRVANLAVTLEASVESARPMAADRGVVLESDVPASAVLVRGDPDRLGQVFANLLNNAIKFTAPGDVVQVSLGRDGSQARAVVCDSGRGIDPVLLPHIFERFRQGESASTRTHGGLGLGLAIVKQLVELHGGSVRAESGGPGKGATFTVCLPLAIDASEEAAVPVLGRAGTGLGLEGLRVLVVEDDIDSRDALELLLTEKGISVETAGSLADALDACEREHPDLLLSDIGLPGGSGYDLIRRIREREDSGRGRLLAIAMTGFASKHDHEEALRAGFDEHLRKPLDIDLLLERMHVLAATLPGRSTI